MNQWEFNSVFNFGKLGDSSITYSGLFSAVSINSSKH